MTRKGFKHMSLDSAMVAVVLTALLCGCEEDEQ